MPKNAWTPSFRVTIAVVALGLVACTSDAPAPGPTQVDLAPLFDVRPDGDLTDPSLGFEISKLCKVGSSADFEVSGDELSDDVHLEDGECRIIADQDGTHAFDLTVTEVASPSGVVLDRIELLTDAGVEVVTGTNTVTRTVPPRTVITYYNRATVPGRMTGGGGQIRIDGVRITRGLTLHCDIVLSNNLEINWTGGNKWHLDKPITSAECVDDPAVSPLPPAAPFDTFIGEAIGALNGEDGSLVRFTFVDAGEPGTDDTAWIRIWAPGADPSVDAPVLEVSGDLDNGNLQAHYDQPHG
jgi:hypothetical protein